MHFLYLHISSSGVSAISHNPRLQVATGAFHLSLCGDAKELISSGWFTVFNEHVPMFSLAIKCDSVFKY